MLNRNIKRMIMPILALLVLNGNFSWGFSLSLSNDFTEFTSDSKIISTPLPNGSAYSLVGNTTAVTPTPTLLLNSDGYGDDFESAFPVPDNTTISGKIQGGEDKDFFSFSEKEDCNVVIKVSIDTNSIEYLHIFEDSNTQIVYNINGNSSITFAASKDKKYFIRIQSTDGKDMNYSLNITRMIDDYGDDFESAVSILPYKQITGNFFSMYDVDMFKFTANKDGVYRFITNKEGAYGIRVYNEDGGAQSNTADNINAYELIKDKTYYVKVEAYGRSEPYEFLMTEPKADEFSNTKDGAKDIVAGEEIHGSLNDRYDVDFLSFKPEKDGVYRFRNFKTMYNNKFYQNPTTSNVLSVYNKESQSVYYTMDSNNTAYMDLKKDEVYYVSISDKYNSNLTFDYSFVFDGPVDDKIGNSQGTSTEINLGDKINGTMDYYVDQDYFKFTPTMDGTYCLRNFNFVLQNEKEDLPKIENVLSVEGGYKKVLTSIEKDGSINVPLLKGKTYYFKISNECYSYPLFSYSFDLEGPIKDDFGGYIETAKEILLDTKIQGKGEYFKDMDFFKIKVEEYGAYFIDDLVQSGYSDFDLKDVVKFYDESGNELLYANIYNGRALVYVSEPRTLYISITNNYYSLLEYSFSLKGPIEDDYGDTYNTAKEIPFNVPFDVIRNYKEDRDCVYFIPSMDGTYFIEDLLQNSDIGDKENIYIVDSSTVMNFCHYDSNVGVNLQKGRKYILVINFSDSNTKYSFNISGPQADDYGNSMQTSGEIKVGSKIEGKMEFNYDKDYFLLKPEKDGTYYLSNYYTSSNNYNANLYVAFKVYDSLGNAVKVDYGFNKAYFDLKKDNNYYLSMESDIFRFDYSFIINKPIENICKIKGYIKPEMYDNTNKASKAGFVVKVISSGQKAISDEDGYFEIPNVSKNDIPCKIEITKPGYLKRVFEVTANKDILISTKESPLELWAGDIQQDDTINMMDVMKIAKAFNTTAAEDAGFNECADFNGDLVINMADIIILAKHFNNTMEDYPDCVSK